MPAAEPPPTRLRYVDGVVGLFRPWMTDRRPAQGGCRFTSDAIEEKRAINIAHAVLYNKARVGMNQISGYLDNRHYLALSE